MKFIHLADLHLGKTVNGFDFIEDQRHIIGEILKTSAEETPQAVIIAGDIYDRPLPSSEAMALFDELLCGLTALGATVLILGGNHDSVERLAFASRLLQPAGVHIAAPYAGRVETVTLEDEYGPVVFHLLPYLRPAQLRPLFPEAPPETHDDAVRAALTTDTLAPGARHVLAAHLFATAAGQKEPERCGSEIDPVGGLGGVDVTAFEGYDYVALGHLHGPQRVGRSSVRYCGSPLKYSFRETRQNKSLTAVELGENGAVAHRLLPLMPLRDMRNIKGPLHWLLGEEAQASGNTSDYIRAVLTDELDLPDPMARLRSVYPNIMELGIENTRTQTELAPAPGTTKPEDDPLALFEQFYLEQNGAVMEEGQRQTIIRLLEEVTAL